MIEPLYLDDERDGNGLLVLRRERDDAPIVALDFNESPRGFDAHACALAFARGTKIMETLQNALEDYEGSGSGRGACLYEAIKEIINSPSPYSDKPKI